MLKNFKKLNCLTKKIQKKKFKSDLTRAEGLTMVLKALGYSQKVAESEKNVKLNPFTDVPEWFKGYAGLGFDLNLTKGKSRKIL